MEGRACGLCEAGKGVQCLPSQHLASPSLWPSPHPHALAPRGPSTVSVPGISLTLAFSAPSPLVAPPCRSSSSRRLLPLPASPPVHPGSLTLLRILTPERALLPFSAWRRLRHFPECLMPTRPHATPRSRIGTTLSDCSSAASLSFLQKTACQPCQSLALRKPDALTLSAA